MTSTTTDRRFGVNSGVAVKAPCLVTTTASITLSGEQTIDGVACVTGDRVLVKDQTSGVDNGIYIVDTGTWTRAPDFNGSFDAVTGTLVPVNSGSTYQGSVWRLTTTGTISVGTTSLTFTQGFNDAASVTYTPSGTVAISDTVQGVLRQRKLITGWIPPALHSAIRARTDTTDLSAYITNAHTDLSSGDTLIWPDGDYHFAEVTTTKLIHHVAEGRGLRSVSASNPSVRWKLYANAAHLYKFSDLQTDSTLIEQTLQINGIALDGNAKTVTDAALVIEGVSKPLLCHGSISNVTGAALRLREVFEPYCFDFGIFGVDASGSSGVVVIDDRYDSNNVLNVNNFRFHLGHMERNQGPYFFAHATANLDVFDVAGTKFEFGIGSVPSGGPWSVFEIRQAQRVNIHGNSFINYSNANKYDVLFEMGYAATFCAFAIHDNDIARVDSSTVALRTLGTSAGEFYDNRGVGSSNVLPSFDIESSGRVRLEPLRNLDNGVAALGSDQLNHNVLLPARASAAGVGLISVHELQPASGLSFAVDANARNLCKTALVSPSTATADAANVPLYMLTGYPASLRLGIRCRSESGAGTINPQFGTTSLGSRVVPSSYAIVWYDIPRSLVTALGDSGSDRFKLRTGTGNAEAVYFDGIYLMLAEYLPQATTRLLDDFLGDVIADQWGGRAGSDPQCVAPAITSGAAGRLRLTAGDDAGGTMALNGSQLESALQWQATQGGLTFEAKFRIDTITDVCLYVGFTDQVSALEMPFTLGGSDALTSNATNAVGVLFDTAADTDQWCKVGVAADVDATHAFAGVAPTAGTFETWRIEITTAGVATFYRNGAQIGSAMTGAVTAATLLTPVVAVFARGASVRNADIDYILVEGNRP